MPTAYSGVKFRDDRSGQWRSARHYERNKHFKVDTLSKGLASFVFKTMDRWAEVANDFADELRQYAHDNAPWNDITGDARAGLETAALVYNGGLQVDLYHTVEYGIWLEVCLAGKYAIIIPSIETMGNRLFDKMEHTLSEIVYYA